VKKYHPRLAFPVKGEEMKNNPLTKEHYSALAELAVMLQKKP
jgi:hypothetical protein